MNETELRAEVERLTELNDGLARQIVGMSDRLQESARQIAADAWDAGVQAGHDAMIGKFHANPHRKPVETLGGGE